MRPAEPTTWIWPDWRACRTNAIRPSRPPCMLTMRWSRPCASTRSRAAEPLDTIATRHWPSEFAAGLAALGIAAAIPAGESSVVLRAYHLPAGVSYAQLHDALKADGFVIYAGQGNLSKSLFRISTMGNLTSADIDRLLQCFARLLK